MTRFKTIAFAAISSLALAACGGGSSGASRDAAWAVGSSTLYPFAAAVAEEVAKGGVKAPKVEQNGSGAGIKLFCAGVGAAHPDIANASRRMKKSEFEDCQKNGVKDIAEIQVGLDGIAFAEATRGPGIALTPVDVYKALAANPFGKPNTAKTWKDVNPALPALPILVYGPPTTSGTRDALAELILAKGCDTDPAMKALKEKDSDAHKKVCTEVREDGAYVDSGEEDNLIVQKLAENPNAIGVFGFSFLEENMDKLKGITMGGVEPTYATISDFSYPGARPLYIYVKMAHLNAVPGLKDFVAAWAKVWGPDGLLKSKGMVISPEDVRNKNAVIAANPVAMDAATLK
ncbi:MAG: substrate-binding domain-containing protein [Alphaproteobacteria bacterium]|jgi:phosphate transport system substrate-binding protein